MKQTDEVVYLVDDDASIREALTDLFESVQLTVVNFASAEEFLRHERSGAAGCLILDLKLPEMSGLDLQEKLVGKLSLPIIFITGQGDIPSSVRAMKAGAVEFLTKPVGGEALIAAVRAAFVRDRESRERRATLEEIESRLALLSPREREALPLIVSGFLNKQSAAMLGITEVTLQIHRGHIMRKMAVSSFAELVRMCGAVGIPDTSMSSEANLPILPSRDRSNGVE